MASIETTTPAIISFSGLDPTGGGGISADIETFASLGCHCAPIIAAVTARDTQTIKDAWDIDSPILIQQARAILEDMDIQAIKIGMLGSVENIEAVHTILTDYPHLPVILDPVLQVGSNDLNSLAEATRALLTPLSRICILNSEQIRQLVPEADGAQACAQALIEQGCEHVFASGSPDKAQKITNSLFSATGRAKTYQWPVIPHRFVGAGNTLSASITAYLAHQDSVLDAVEQGQNFTWKALKHGRRVGMGNWLPNRIFWCESN